MPDVDLGIILGIVGALIGIAGIAIGLWVSRRSAMDVKGAITLLGLAGLDQDFEVRWRGQAVKVPSLVNVTVCNLGPKDVSVRDFEGGLVEIDYTQARAVGILADGTSDPDAWDLVSDPENGTFTIRLLPRIMKPQEPMAVTILCDGVPRRSKTSVRISGVREMSRRRRWVRRYGLGVVLAIVLGIATGTAFYLTLGPRDPNAPRVEFSPPQRAWIAIAFGVVYGAIVLIYTWGRYALRARRRRAEEERAKGIAEPESRADRAPDSKSQVLADEPTGVVGEQVGTAREERAALDPRRIAPRETIRAAAAYHEALLAGHVQASVRATSQGVRVYLPSSGHRVAALQALTPEYERFRVPYRFALGVPQPRNARGARSLVAGPDEDDHRSGQTGPQPPADDMGAPSENPEVTPRN
ncbi:MAG: hypothetical protein QM779_02900 [Propionicimonas sp.]|uniref:hypothetical protein n=1 Tax=Propionicimonas sp. TaxID=1955623 RepID=UPI003D0C0488